MKTTAGRISAREHQLHDEAARLTGYEDFGDTGYREGLRVLLEAFDSDLRLTDIGQQMVFNSVLSTLKARLYAERGWKAVPAVLATPIHRPVFVLGLPRTGTTAMHRLLSIDDQFQGIETWLL